jgi:hypothetical protein
MIISFVEVWLVSDEYPSMNCKQAAPFRITIRYKFPFGRLFLLGTILPGIR